MAQPGVRPETSGFFALVAAIIADAAELLSKQLSAASLEIKEDLAATKTAAVAVGAGLVLAFVGFLMAIFMLAHLIQTVAELDLWICYGIVGFALLIVGALLLLTAKKQMASVNFLPNESIAKAKEDWVWLAQGRKSDAKSN